MSLTLLAVSAKNNQPDKDHLVRYLVTTPAYGKYSGLLEYQASYSTAYFTIGEEVYTAYLFEGEVVPDFANDDAYLVIYDIENTVVCEEIVRTIRRQFKAALGADKAKIGEICELTGEPAGVLAISYTFSEYDPVRRKAISPITKTTH